MSMPVAEVRKHLMSLSFEQRTELAYEVLDGMADDDTGDAKPSLFAEAIARRVDEIRNGAPLSAEEQEVLDEMDRAAAEPDGDLFDDLDDGEDEDPAEVEAAWADEIAQRAAEIRDGTAKTYAAEDVMVALTLRYG
jgi:hypothetical protein